MTKVKPHPTNVPHNVYLRIKMVSIVHHEQLYKLTTEAAKEYLSDIEKGVVDPSTQAKEYEEKFKDEKPHTWNLTMDDKLYKELRHLSINYDLELYKSVSMAVTRYLDHHYPED